jgi:hypothetical protein
MDGTATYPVDDIHRGRPDALFETGIRAYQPLAAEDRFAAQQVVQQHLLKVQEVAQHLVAVTQILKQVSQLKALMK